ncbi:Uncharacterised protein [Mycobacterium tuberculosis]|uniref:Uncharacterized protein n=1 Tax=Mycobacterium tuberculosis TaxID=1773 RepID=A0A0U0SJT4_MYCTX|nr:Uncharacterised protein [Mycobacterium tuberculosis]COV68204.1 Uncharacterised protein [Mycobacterium tuberculosis]COW85881.1 Uncharacterised protein [Mycobacterium tuberculosis]
MLWVDRGRLPLGQAEEIAVKPADVVQKGAPTRYRSTRDTRFGVVVHVRVPPVSGNLTHQIVAA